MRSTGCSARLGFTEHDQVWQDLCRAEQPVDRTLLQANTSATCYRGVKPIKARFIYLFLDGVGLDEAGPFNPLTPYEADGQTVEPMPYLAGRLGRSLLAGPSIEQPGLLLKPVDASLGVPGRPQSATGQTALYTGRNAPAFLGRHLTGFANGSLRILLEESGLFKQVQAVGGRATSANLYTPGYFQAIAERKLRYSVGSLLSLTADVPFRMPADYERGRAIFWDITNAHGAGHDFQPPPLDPQEAGKRLARLAADYDVTLFECYLTDFAGHRQDRPTALIVLAEVDGLIQGVLETMNADTTLVICSDHGNLENLATRLHTLNPVPLLVFGPAASSFATVTDIMGLTPAIVSRLVSD